MTVRKGHGKEKGNQEGREGKKKSQFLPRLKKGKRQAFKYRKKASLWR